MENKKVAIGIEMGKKTFSNLMEVLKIASVKNQEKYAIDHGVKIVDSSIEIGYQQAKIIYSDSSSEIVKVIEEK